MTELSSVATVRRFFDAFAARDLATIQDCLADDLVVRTYGSDPWAGEYHGRDAWIAVLKEVYAAVGPSYRPEAREFRPAGPALVAVLGRSSATLEQGHYEEDWVIVQRVQRGEIVEWFGIPGGTGEPQTA